MSILLHNRKEFAFLFLFSILYSSSAISSSEFIEPLSIDVQDERTIFTAGLKRAQFYVENLKKSFKNPESPISHPKVLEQFTKDMNRVRLLISSREKSIVFEETLAEGKNWFDEGVLNAPKLLYLYTKAISLIPEKIDDDPNSFEDSLFENFRTLKSKGFQWDNFSPHKSDRVFALKTQTSFLALPFLAKKPYLGLQTMNYLFAMRAQLIGAPLVDCGFHGRVDSPPRFLDHDLGHLSQWVKGFGLFEDEKLDQLKTNFEVLYRKLYTEISKEEELKDFQKAHVGYFLFTHEFNGAREMKGYFEEDVSVRFETVMFEANEMRKRLIGLEASKDAYYIQRYFNHKVKEIISYEERPNGGELVKFKSDKSDTILKEEIHGVFTYSGRINFRYKNQGELMQLLSLAGYNPHLKTTNSIDFEYKRNHMLLMNEYLDDLYKWFVSRYIDKLK